MSQLPTVACSVCGAQVTDLERHHREAHAMASAPWIAWAQCPTCLEILRREGLESHMARHRKVRRPRHAANTSHGTDERR